MKRATLLVLAVVVLVSVAYADDVWKAKPYQQWDAKDVQKVLNESPWVRTVHVTAAWRKPGENNIPLDPGGNSPGNYGAQGASGASGSGASSGSASAPSAYGMPGPGAPSNANSGSMAQNQAIMNSAKTPEATFMVRWFSALAVRQALARAQVLGGAMTAADADKALTDAPAEYAIVIAGADMAPFVKADEKDLAAKASVQPKNGEKMAASHVAIQRLPGAKPEDPRSIAAVVFYFPKKIASGEPLFSSNTKSVEFACPVAGATIKASFDLPKMSGANGPDW
jgi:hypothetical protein